jgi:hypothetical protein
VKKNLAAVVQQIEYMNIRNSKQYVAWIYDKDQPRIPDSEDIHALYSCVDMLGPFKTKDAAIRACTDIGIGG